MLDTWPFFAPSHEAAIDAALDLAGVGPDRGLIDLGCGDGAVLVAAARRGAPVRGIEADPELAAEAEANLARSGLGGEVVVADLLEGDLDLDLPDVSDTALFAYLAPATLQRLIPRLGRRSLVTVDFDVPGLVPARRAEPVRLYRLPGRRRRVPAPGWAAAGTLLTVVPEYQSLSCLDAVHPGGAVSVRLEGGLDGAVTAIAGADRLDGPAHLAVDLRWEPLPDRTVVVGELTVRGLPRHSLIGVVTDEDHGLWELTADAVGRIRRALAGDRAPTTLTALLATAG